MPTPVEPKTAEEAVTAALAEVTTPAPSNDPPEPTEPVEPVEPIEGDEPVDGEAPAIEEPEAEETAEAKAEREAAEAAETPEAKAEREAAEAAAKKPADPINDPIPNTVAPRTRERITSLVATVKDLQPRAERGDELFETIAKTGMNADEFAMALTYGRMVHSTNIEDHRRAYAFVMNEAKNLAAKIGEVLPGTNPLEGHADLTAAVTNKQITEDHAVELARRRNAEKANTQHTQQQQQVQETETQFNQARNGAIAELNALGQQLHAADPVNFKAKYDQIVPIMKEITPQLHPGQWKNAFLRAWNAIKVAPAAAAPPAAKPGPQPLRANKQPPGGGAKQPTSMEEAVRGSLGMT